MDCPILSSSKTYTGSRQVEFGCRDEYEIPNSGRSRSEQFQKLAPTKNSSYWDAHKLLKNGISSIQMQMLWWKVLLATIIMILGVILSKIVSLNLDVLDDMDGKQ